MAPHPGAKRKPRFAATDPSAYPGFEPYDDPYDVLLDDFERDMTTAEVVAVFERIREEQGRLIAGDPSTAAD